jgi:hypothetical protein
MPDEISAGAGDLAAGSTATSDTTPVAETASPTKDPSTLPADLQPFAPEALPASEEAPPAEEAEKKPDEQPKTEPEKPEEPSPEKKEPKSVVEQRKHIDSLEGQLKPLRELESKILEAGGLPILEAARPLLDAALNPGASAGEILGALAEIAPYHNAQDLAWGLLETPENQTAALEHFFGEGITPDLIEKLIAGHREGRFELDGDLDSEADSVFLSDREKADRARVKEIDARDAASKTTERQALETKLGEERKAAKTAVATLCSDSVDAALTEHQLMLTKDDESVPEVKGMKELVNKAIQSLLMVQFSQDPIYQRVHALIEKNGLKAADSLAKGSLAVRMTNAANELAKQFQPFVTSTVGQAQARAKTIKDVRAEPDGALGQQEATPRKEINAKNPNWRKELDAEYAQRIADLPRKQAREASGRFA